MIKQLDKQTAIQWQKQGVRINQATLNEVEKAKRNIKNHRGQVYWLNNRPVILIQPS